MYLIDAPVGAAYHLVTALSGAIHPALGPVATGAAIVLFTVAVRAALLPLAFSQVRAERARARLRPRVDELRRRHAEDPVRQQREISRLYAAEGTSAFAGCLPALAQWPFFAVMYRLFVSATVAGHQNALLATTLLGAPLGQNMIGTFTVYGLFAPPSLVCVALLVLITAVAWHSSRRAGRTAPADGTGRLMRLMPYGTVAVAAFVPLAAGVYLLTTTAWTAAERTLLRRDTALAA